MPVTKAPFGVADGQPVDLYTLSNANGLMAKIATYGGIIQELHVPGRDGKTADVVLGFDTLESYLPRHPYFGALVGRYANRLADGAFTLDGVDYALAKNAAGDLHLHGGVKGYDKAVWQAETSETDGACTLTLSHVSPDGDEGYPGALSLKSIYALNDDGELSLEFVAETDKPTILNLTNHSYFNLAGHDSGDILDQTMIVCADGVTPTNERLLPTGDILSVDGTAYDFRDAKPIGRDVADIPDLAGYDINFVVNGEPGTMRKAAEAFDPKSGRLMEVLTTQPGIQLYTAFKLSGITGKGGAEYGPSQAFCLETQHFPDAPNQPSFPTTVLRPGETFREKTLFRFSVR